MKTPLKIKSSAIALLLLVAGLLSGCAGNDTAEPPRSVDRGDLAAATALRQVGVPYRYGGSDTSGFDCSGLVQYSWGRAGVSVPRTTGQQWSGIPAVDASNLRRGDVLFFNIEGKMSHVGLYVGDGRFVHAPSTGRTVVVEDLNSAYYSSRLLRAGRPR